MNIKKMLLPILGVLIIASGMGGYLFGFNRGKIAGFSQGRIALQQELKVKEEEYQKSRDAAKELATKYLNDLKFNDFKGAYALTCTEFKSKVAEQKYIKVQEGFVNKLDGINVYIQNYVLEDVVVEEDSAKIRFNEVRRSTFLDKDVSFPGQSQFKLIDGRWCPMPLAEIFLN